MNAPPDSSLYSSGMTTDASGLPEDDALVFQKISTGKCWAANLLYANSSSCCFFESLTNFQIGNKPTSGKPMKAGDALTLAAHLLQAAGLFCLSSCASA